MDEPNTQPSVRSPWLEQFKFKPGVSGNPRGSSHKARNGLSIRAKIVDYLEKNPMEVAKLVKHFVENNPELTWQMLEGRPPQSLYHGGPDGEQLGEPSEVVKEIATKLNELLGGPGVGGHGDAASALGLEAPNQDQ
jgi:hypothetical protein